MAVFIFVRMHFFKFIQIFYSHPKHINLLIWGVMFKQQPADAHATCHEKVQDNTGAVLQALAREIGTASFGLAERRRALPSTSSCCLCWTSASARDPALPRAASVSGSGVTRSAGIMGRRGDDSVVAISSSVQISAKPAKTAKVATCLEVLGPSLSDGGRTYGPVCPCAAHRGPRPPGHAPAPPAGLPSPSAHPGGPKKATQPPPPTHWPRLLGTM